MTPKRNNQSPESSGVSRHPCKGQVLSAASGPGRAYLSTELATAPPPRLRRMLLDAAVARCREAVEALDADDAETARRQLSRARQSLSRLRDTLGALTDEQTQRAFELYLQADTMLTEARQYTRRRTVLDTLDLLLQRRSVLTSPTAGAAVRSSAWLA
ncbi:MAG: flagellar protein FliS [Phycisphaerae bacterium]